MDYFVGDKFFDINSRTYFELEHKKANHWIVRWHPYDYGTGMIYEDELDALKLFDEYVIIKIKDDKHLLQLELKYG